MSGAGIASTPEQPYYAVVFTSRRSSTKQCLPHSQPRVKRRGAALGGPSRRIPALDL